MDRVSAHAHFQVICSLQNGLIILEAHGCSVWCQGVLWAIDMDAGTPFSSELYRVSPNAFLPKDWIMEKWEQGYYITAVAGEGGGGVHSVDAWSWQPALCRKGRWELSLQVTDWLGHSACCPFLPLASFLGWLGRTGRSKVNPHVSALLPGVYGTFWAAEVCHIARAGNLGMHMSGRC